MPQPIYIDEYLIIIEKPAGLLSVPGKAEDNKDCVINRILPQFSDAHIVHRLDMATSGLMILARGLPSHRALSMAFEKRQIQKKYVAILHGELCAKSGLIDAPMITDWPNRPAQKIDFENGKAAQTYYKVLGVENGNSRVEFSPITGRSHQLRLHAIHIGHPICGDRFYIGEDGFARLCLHASELKFTHPFFDEEMHFESIPKF